MSKNIPMYCVKCKARTGTGKLRFKQTSNGQPMATGGCTRCGTQKCRFMKKGRGIGDWINKAVNFGTKAYNVGKKVYDIGHKVYNHELTQKYGPHALNYLKRKMGGRIRRGRRRRTAGAIQKFVMPTRNTFSLAGNGIGLPGSRHGGAIRSAVSHQPAIFF